MPERVIAQLEPLLGEKAHFLHAPRALLPRYSLLAEERVPRRRTRKEAERRTLPPVGMLLAEREPDADPAVRVDLQLAVLLDPRSNRLGRCIVERGTATGDVLAGISRLLVDQLRHRDRPVAAIVQQLEVAPEVIGRTAPATVVVGDQVILEDRDAAGLVRWTRRQRNCAAPAEVLRARRRRRLERRDKYVFTI